MKFDIVVHGPRFCPTMLVQLIPPLKVLNSTMEQLYLSRPSPETMNAVFQLCRIDDWGSVLTYLESNPTIGITPMVMDNHITTTVLHQAITSKGDTELRAQLIRKILKKTPEAAKIKNGYGSLPLHVISQVS
jgi:hypothetical protein